MKPRANEHQPAWLLMKERDDHARPVADHDVVVALPHSVLRPPAAARPTGPS